MYAFVCTWSRRPDRVLFLAADLHDLPRQAARPDHDVEACHESPLVMLVPLVVLAPARSSPAGRSHFLFIGGGGEGFWNGGALRRRPGNTCIAGADGARAGCWVELRCRLGDDGLSASRSPMCVYRAARTCRANSPRASAASTCSCSTNGISTSSTTDLRAPGDLARPRCCGRAATARSSTASAPTASRRSVLDGSRAGACRCRPATLSLRLRHADRRRRAGHLVHVRGDPHDDGAWPLLSSSPSCRWSARC
jgi:hypothetical protein